MREHECLGNLVGTQFVASSELNEAQSNKNPSEVESHCPRKAYSDFPPLLYGTDSERRLILSILFIKQIKVLWDFIYFYSFKY